MSVIEGPSFPITSDLILATNEQFTFGDEKDAIRVFVEGFEDIPIWNEILKKSLKVNVSAFGETNKANGKGSIISEIKNGKIVLGKNLIAALDSDYDFLLNRNSDTFNLPTVLQTYAYSIENLIWHPNKIDSACQTASQDTVSFRNDGLKKSLIEWSRNIYPLFMEYLKNGASDSKLFDEIMDSLSVDLEKFTIIFNGRTATFNDVEFEQAMQAKGLTPETTFLFVRGHDYAKKLETICEALNNEAFKRRKRVIESDTTRKIDASNQLIGEIKNAQLKPGVVIKGAPLECNICMPKIARDIEQLVKHLS
ncbi:DUF4435 domain-containing protein [Aeromonas veronii]|uniref:DUF4435 domain-containing protein n=1 Tax=Aeromonas veronii TaxID=654 RepID=UPI002245AEC2|nr:DUF4435 domain-containing protein [Aeromonas veronii]MCX0433201.1 DUF4435 domain-containing protein [Aeromonas veronii]